MTGTKGELFRKDGHAGTAAHAADKIATLLAAGRETVAGVGTAIDAPTLLPRFALMIVSAQFQAIGFYRYAAEPVTAAPGGPVRLLATGQMAP